MERFNVGQSNDFAADSMTQVEVDGHDILVVHQNGAFYAMPNQCTHAKFPLHDGELLDGKVKCQYHGATYDLETGKPTMPAIKKIRLYSVAVENGDVFVEVVSN